MCFGIEKQNGDDFLIVCRSILVYLWRYAVLVEHYAFYQTLYTRMYVYMHSKCYAKSTQILKLYYNIIQFKLS